MKKETLLEIILGTTGGLVFAIGMCMCLIPEWNLLKAGCIIATLGFLILLCIISIYRNNHQKKEPINWSIVTTWVLGVIGALIMGYGMSKIMTGNKDQIDMLVGIIISVIGLIVCVLNYPIYSYITSNKK